MLRFFRKYQRIFLVCITAVIVVSFSFFGTFFTLSSPFEKKKEIEVGKAIDGSKIFQSDLFLLSYLLNEGSSQIYPSYFFCGEVLEKDFLKTNLAQVLFTEYFSSFSSQFADRLTKIKQYAPYAHPEAPFLSAQMVWSHFSPEINKILEKLQKEEEVSSSLYTSLVDLYLEQKKFSPLMLKQVLSYYQNQYPQIPKDPTLLQRDFSLFGYHSFKEWFGSDFLDLISQFIHNVAILAEKEGISISRNEVMNDLLENFQKATEGEKGIEDTKAAFHKQLAAFGLDQKTITKGWKKVLLCRKYLNVHLPKQELAAKEEALPSYKAEVEWFELPKVLQFTSFTELLQFQLYIEAVSALGFSLDLPKEKLPVEEIAKSYPELIEEKYLIELAKTTKKQAGLKIGEKAVIDWELEKENWDTLVTSFPNIFPKGVKADQERFLVLENLSEKKRKEVDQFARENILNSDPTWIEKSLLSQKKENISLALRKKGGSFSLQGIQNPEKLIEWIRKAPLVGAESLTEEERKAQTILYCYTEDNKNYFSISIIEKPSSLEVVPFTKALQDGTMETLLNRYLEKHYGALKEKFPHVFKDDQGQWLSFSNARERIGRYLWKDLFSSLEGEVPRSSERELSLDFYVKNRFFPELMKIQKTIEENPSQDLMIGLWPVSRKKEILISENEPFSLSPGELSSIEEHQGSLRFFSLIEQKLDEEKIEEEKREKMEIRRKEELCLLTKSLLEQLKERAIHLSHE